MNRKTNNYFLSTRQLKVGEMIRRALVEVLGKGKFLDINVNELPITISEVRVSADLRNATVYVLPLLGNNISKEVFMDSLKNIAPMIRKMVTKKVQLRYSPELVFKFDDSFEQANKINALFESIPPTEIKVES